MTTIRGQAGFTILEAVVAAAIFTIVAAMLFDFLVRGQRLAQAQPDSADVTQRLRVAAAAIGRDIINAGAADPHGRLGTLANYFPPIVPARTGSSAPDEELTAYADRLSVVYVPDEGWYTQLMSDMGSAAGDVWVDPSIPGCPGGGACGFAPGRRAAIVNTADLGAGHDIFSVTAVTADALGHGSPNPAFTQAYTRASAAVVPLVQRVYYLDRASRRLMVYDGFKSAFPVVDNVVKLEFMYFGDAHPASVAVPAGAAGNCVFGPGTPPVPRLLPLGPPALVPIPLALFEDGPYCGVWPNRFDGDLLRIRRVRVTLRVQAALEHVRGRGVHFLLEGSSRSELSTVRDFETTFDVAPRNMSPTR